MSWDGACLRHKWFNFHALVLKFPILAWSACSDVVFAKYGLFFVFFHSFTAWVCPTWKWRKPFRTRVLRFHEDDRVSKRDRTGREWIEISEISWHHPDTMKEEMQNILILGFLDHLLPIYPDNPDKNSTSSKYPDLPVRILTSGHHAKTKPPRVGFTYLINSKR